MTVEDAQTMSISWITPPQIVNQGLGGFQLAITAECFTGAQPTATQTYSIRPDEPPSQRIVDLREYSLYPSLVSRLLLAFNLACCTFQ